MRTMITVLAFGAGASIAGTQTPAGAQTPQSAPQAQTVEAWADSARAEIEAAYIEGDIERLVRARALVERALTRFPDDALLLHYKGYAYYREANLRQATDGGSDSDELLEAAIEPLERSNELEPMPETQALLASAIGQRIGSNPLRGMTMGPRADRWMQRAVQTDPENPRVWLLRGIGAIFKPRMFGGGLDRAEADLRKAIELFEQDDPRPPAPAWGHGEAWIWLGQALVRQGNPAEARAAYLTALEHEPENAWLREVLLPALDTDR
jgi:tetratricopeptide (TPR) repeat protein